MTQWGLDTLFNPAKRHMDEEKRRLQATRQQVGDTSGGKRIDLESGKVRIGKKADGEPAPDDAVATPADEAADMAEDGSTPSSDASKPARSAARGKKPSPEQKLSPAQIRAAERRRRTPR